MKMTKYYISIRVLLNNIFEDKGSGHGETSNRLVSLKSPECAQDIQT